MAVSYYQLFILSSHSAHLLAPSREAHSQHIASHVNQDQEVSDQQKGLY